MTEESFGERGTDPREVFTLTEKLGEGSYGSVWRGRHNKSGKDYAVKRVGIDNDLEDLELEIQFMKSCHSEHIVRYFASYVCGQELWIVMELCAAGSVSDLMHVTGRTLTEPQIVSVVRDMLLGLQFLHERKKIHRDIKCGNVLLNDAGEGKLADFGVSGQISDTMAKRHTVIGTVCSSPLPTIAFTHTHMPWGNNRGVSRPAGDSRSGWRRR